MRTRPAPLVLLVAACADDRAARLAFERDVVPVLERTCAATTCHGVAVDAEQRGEVVDWGTLVFRVDAMGHIVDTAAAREAALRAVDTTADPLFSTLLRKPLPAPYGGIPHFGGADFSGPDDPGVVAIARWIALEAIGGEDAQPLNARERVFHEHIERPLLSLGCGTAGCHGLSSAIPFRLDPGVGGELPTAATRANLAAVSTMLSLDGDPMLSRLVRKMLPTHLGGIVHKGGNRSFLTGPADPRLTPMLAWICAERERQLGAGCPATGEPLWTGLIYVRGPVAPAHPFDVEGFTPGSDLVLAEIVGDVVHVERDLTSRLHPGPADVRDPAVDPTGTRVAFAMRTSAEVGHDLWVLNLDTGEATRVLEGGRDPIVTHRDPTWAPDGSLWFVSTRAGVMADAGRYVDTDLYRVDLATGELTRRSYTPHMERKPVFFVHGEEAGGEVGFSALRDAIPAQARAHIFRFPPGLATEYHQHFGITPVEDLFYDMRELPDGRYVTIVGDLDNVWGGRPGIVDRNFGPEIPWSGPLPALPLYAPPLSRLDPEATAAGSTGAIWRDPVALPDGTLLAARAVGALDHADPAIVPSFHIVRVTLAEPAGPGGTHIDRIDVLIDHPDSGASDPEPVYRRQPAPMDDPSWDPTATTARLVHQGFPQIDALLTNLPPAGEKAPRADLSAVRVVEHLPLSAALRRPVPAAETRDGHPGATTASLGSHGPARVLLELPLQADGTFQVELPAGIAVRLQGLDTRGLAVGTMHNRWFDLMPGQTIKQGVQPHHYGTLCAACHGAADGDPDHAFGIPDLITTASLTQARYRDQHPRHPLPAPVAGQLTRVEVDFRREVQPILTARCSPCHGGDVPAAGLSLTDQPTRWYTDAYESLLAPGWGSGGGMALVDEPDGSAFHSHLAERLLGEELGAEATLPTPEQPHPDEPMDADDLRTILRWIDLGATFVGTVEGP